MLFWGYVTVCLSQFALFSIWVFVFGVRVFACVRVCVFACTCTFIPLSKEPNKANINIMIKNKVRSQNAIAEAPPCVTLGYCIIS